MRIAFFSVPVLVLSLVATACTQDFGQYEPTGDASAVKDGPSGDAKTDGTVGDSGTEAGCTPPAGCLDTAKNCVDQCRNQRDACNNGCGSNQTCKQNCFNTYSNTCKPGCNTACLTCTTNAGCRAESACSVATN